MRTTRQWEIQNSMFWTPPFKGSKYGLSYRG